MKQNKCYTECPHCQHNFEEYNGSDDWNYCPFCGDMI